MYRKSRIVTTEIGIFVLGTTAKFVVTPVFKLVNKKANASEYWHWKFPYSSDAKIKSKLKFEDIGKKSNSNTVAFEDVIGIPAAAKVASKLASPIHALDPSFNNEVFGPGAFNAFPVLRITPLCIGKLGFVFWKKPIPFEEPKFVPVLQVIFVALTHVELISTLLTNCSTVWLVVLTLTGCEKQSEVNKRIIKCSVFFIIWGFWLSKYAKIRRLKANKIDKMHNK